jgi:methylated-DNA-protein-cysteine methyltransferase-like protein
LIEKTLDLEHMFDYIKIRTGENSMARYTSPPNSEFYKAQVWAIVRHIPAGKVATYGQIAAIVPIPAGVDPDSYRAFGARWVGGAMANCPADVPWQRVINAQGKISLPEGGGRALQRDLLEAEGVEFDDRDRINLDNFRWDGPTSPKPD